MSGAAGAHHQSLGGSPEIVHPPVRHAALLVELGLALIEAANGPSPRAAAKTCLFFLNFGCALMMSSAA